MRALIHHYFHSLIIERFGGPQVTVIVGDESRSKKQFVLPKALLCHYSTYFDRCFNGEFVEARNQEVELDEDDPEIFALLVEWIVRLKLRIWGWFTIR